MQRDLDDRDLSRRTYNGDLLFQHWYQKVRPTIGNAASSSTQAPVQAPLATSSNQTNPQASGDAGPRASSPNTSSDEGQATDTSAVYIPDNSPDPAMADSASTGVVSITHANGEMANMNSSPPRGHSALDVASPTDSVADAGMEPTPPSQLPLRGLSSTATISSSCSASRTTKKRAIKDTTAGNKAEAASVPAKKHRRGKKAVQRVFDSDSDDGEREHGTSTPKATNPRSSTKRLPSSTTAEPVASSTPYSSLPLKRFGPPLNSPHFEQDEDRYHLSHPVPIPGDSSLSTAARDLYSNAPSIGARPGPSSYRSGGPPVSSSSISAPRPLPSSQIITPFTQDDGEAARIHHHHHRGAGGSAYRGSSQYQNHQMGSGSGSGQERGHVLSHHQGGASPVSAPAAMAMRIDPVTGQRLGEVTLQGPTLMTYCPSCQRPF